MAIFLVDLDQANRPLMSRRGAEFVDAGRASRG